MPTSTTCHGKNLSRSFLSLDIHFKLPHSDKRDFLQGETINQLAFLCSNITDGQDPKLLKWNPHLTETRESHQQTVLLYVPSLFNTEH